MSPHAFPFQEHLELKLLSSIVLAVKANTKILHSHEKKAKSSCSKIKGDKNQELKHEPRTRELQEQTRSTRKQTSAGVVRAAKQGPRRRTETESRIKCEHKTGKTHNHESSANTKLKRFTLLSWRLVILC